MTATEILAALAAGQIVYATQATGMRRTVRVVGAPRAQFGRWLAETPDDANLVRGTSYVEIDMGSAFVMDDDT